MQCKLSWICHWFITHLLAYLEFGNLYTTGKYPVLLGQCETEHSLQEKLVVHFHNLESGYMQGTWQGWSEKSHPLLLNMVPWRQEWCGYSHDKIGRKSYRYFREQKPWLALIADIVLKRFVWNKQKCENTVWLLCWLILMLVLIKCSG